MGKVLLLFLGIACAFPGNNLVKNRALKDDDHEKLQTYKTMNNRIINEPEYLKDMAYKEQNRSGMEVDYEKEKEYKEQNRKGKDLEYAKAKEYKEQNRKGA